MKKNVVYKKLINTIILNIVYNNKLLYNSKYDSLSIMIPIENRKVCEKNDINTMIYYLSKMFYFNKSINSLLYKDHICQFEEIIDDIDFIEVTDINKLEANEMFI